MLCPLIRFCVLHPKGWLTASMFFGMMLGGWVWGSAADKHGRRATLMFSLLVNAVFGFISAFADNYEGFVVLRILSGLGYEALCVYLVSTWFM